MSRSTSELNRVACVMKHIGSSPVANTQQINHYDTVRTSRQNTEHFQMSSASSKKNTESARGNISRRLGALSVLQETVCTRVANDAKQTPTQAVRVDFLTG